MKIPRLPQLPASPVENSFECRAFVFSGFAVAVNLRLPAGQMAARASAETLHAAIRVAFADLTEQLGKHKEHLRSAEDVVANIEN